MPAVFFGRRNSAQVCSVIGLPIVYSYNLILWDCNNDDLEIRDLTIADTVELACEPEIFSSSCQTTDETSEIQTTSDQTNECEWIVRVVRRTEGQCYCLCGKD